MNEQELEGILHSDMALWEAAYDEPGEPGTIVKVLDLPYGIGLTEVTLGGMDNAIGKRGALEAFGSYIRSVVKDRTDDEAVTARAKQAAARAEPEDSENGIYVGTQRVQDEAPVPEATEESSEAHDSHGEAPAGLRETLTAQRATLVEGIEEAEADLTRWSRELRAVNSALKVLGDDNGTPSD